MEKSQKQTDFGQLLRDSLSLVAHVDNEGIPAIQRNLTQLDGVSRKLAQRNVLKTADAQLDSQAQMFLAGSGLDILAQNRNLRSIDLSQTYESLEPISELDVDKFSEHQHQMLINTAIEETTKLTASSFRRHYISKIESDWEKEKMDLLDSMGYRSGVGLGAPPRAVPTVSDPRTALGRGTPFVGSSGQGTSMTMEQTMFAEEVIKLNRHRKENTPYPVIWEFMNTSHRVDDHNDRLESESHVIGCWKLLQSIVNEKPPQEREDVKLQLRSEDSKKIGSGLGGLGSGLGGGGGDGSELREFLKSYYSEKNIPTRLFLIQGAKRYAEQLYVDVINSEIERNKIKARLQGSPTLLAKLHAFLRLNQHRLTNNLQGSVDRSPLWPLVFLAYRCGDLNTALQVLAKAKREGANDVGTVEECIKEVVKSKERQKLKQRPSEEEQGLPLHLWKKLNQEWITLTSPTGRSDESHGFQGSDGVYGVSGMYDGPSRQSRGNNRGPDLYKVALYAVLGRFDVDTMEQPTDIFKCIGLDALEDYLWFRLSIVWESGPQLPEWLDTPRDTDPRGLAYNRLSLQALQTWVLSGGEKEFNPDGKNPFSYFRVLLCTLLFNQAVNYLVSTEWFWSGVHFAIALDYYGLLHTTTDQGVIDGMDIEAESKVNLVRILQRAIEPFMYQNPTSAFHYLYLLHPTSPIDTKSKSKQETIADDRVEPCYAWDPSHGEVQRLLLTTRQFERLIGTIRKGRVAKDGPIYLFYTDRFSRSSIRGSVSGVDDEARHVILGAARQGEINGSYGDAIKLYTLAEDEEGVGLILIKQLSKWMSSPANHPNRMELVKHLDQFLLIKKQQGPTEDYTAGSGFRNSPSVRSGVRSSGLVPYVETKNEFSNRELVEQLEVLRGLIRFFDLVHDGPHHFDEALRVLESLRIFPTILREDLDEVERRFQRLHHQIKANFAPVAVACMEIYQKKYQTVMEELSIGRSRHSVSNTPRPGPSPFLGGVSSTTPSRIEQDRQKVLEEFRGRARMVNNWIALQHQHTKISGETINKLLQLEASMS